MVARQRPTGAAVVKLTIRPENRVVAGRTLSYRETSRDVVHRRSCIIEVGRVAERTSRVRGGEVVIAVVALITVSYLSSCRDQLVRTRERETGGAVIECCRGPGGGVVAGRTILTLERCVGLGRGDVIRIRRAFIVVGVAAIPAIPAIGRHHCKVRVVAVMAALAGRLTSRDQLVGVLQREISVVRELSIGPGHGVMAARALRR